MGVDFNACDKCGQSRYEEYVAECQKCYNSLCTDCLINKGGKDTPFAHEYGIEFDIDNLEEMQRLHDEDGGIFKPDGTPYYSDGEFIADSAIQPKYCPFCSGNAIDDAEMLQYFLDEYKRDYNLSKEEIWEEVKRQRNDK